MIWRCVLHWSVQQCLSFPVFVRLFLPSDTVLLQACHNYAWNFMNEIDAAFDDHAIKKSSPSWMSFWPCHCASHSSCRRFALVHSLHLGIWGSVWMRSALISVTISFCPCLSLPLCLLTPCCCTFVFIQRGSWRPTWTWSAADSAKMRNAQQRFAKDWHLTSKDADVIRWRRPSDLNCECNWIVVFVTAIDPERRAPELSFCKYRAPPPGSCLVRYFSRVHTFHDMIPCVCLKFFVTSVLSWVIPQDSFFQIFNVGFKPSHADARSFEVVSVYSSHSVSWMT